MAEQQKVKNPKFKLQTRAWFPYRLGEALYRTEVGQSIYWPALDDDAGRVIKLALRYAGQLRIDVETRVGKMIVEVGDEDIVRQIVVLTPSGNEQAAAYAAETSGAAVDLQSGKKWYPLKIGEAIYRVLEGDSLYWPVPENDSNRVMALAKSYASRMAIKVGCKLGKMIIADDSGKDVVRRVVIMTPQGNPRAAEYAAKLAQEGVPDQPEGDISPEVAESFFAAKKPVSDGSKRRGRPPVIKTPEDQKKWDEEWKRREAVKGEPEK